MYFLIKAYSFSSHLRDNGCHNSHVMIGAAPIVSVFMDGTIFQIGMLFVLYGSKYGCLVCYQCCGCETYLFSTLMMLLLLNFRGLTCTINRSRLHRVLRLLPR